MSSATEVLILPGWGGPRPGHWSSQWPRRHGHALLQQHDWQRPLRGDWLMALQEAVLARTGPLVLAADGLACLLVAAWAAHSPQGQRVCGALLVEPMALESDLLHARLPSWSPVVLQRLPFPSLLVAGLSAPHAPRWAQAWGSRCRPGAEAQADPDWPQGHALLREFIKD